MKVKDQKAYDAWKDNNSDPYGKATRYRYRAKNN